MSDPLDNLPPGPTSADPVLTTDQIKTALSAKLYDELTDGDDSITERCIDAAAIQAEGLLAVVGIMLDPENLVHREVLRNITIYELYVYAGDTKGGKVYLQSATDMVSLNYGSVESAQSSNPPIGAIKVPCRHRRLP